MAESPSCWFQPNSDPITTNPTTFGQRDIPNLCRFNMRLALLQMKHLSHKWSLPPEFFLLPLFHLLLFAPPPPGESANRPTEGVKLSVFFPCHWALEETQSKEAFEATNTRFDENLLGRNIAFSWKVCHPVHGRYPPRMWVAKGRAEGRMCLKVYRCVSSFWGTPPNARFFPGRPLKTKPGANQTTHPPWESHAEGPTPGFEAEYQAA